MRFSDYFRLGWDQLKRRIVVTLLCAMGIAIGSSSIIVAVSFGESINHYSKQQMGLYLKTDEITLYGASSEPEGAADPGTMNSYALTEAKIDIIRTLPHVQAVSTIKNLNSMQIQADMSKRSDVYEVVITELETLADFGYELQQGSFSDLENAIILSYGATMGFRDEASSRIITAQTIEQSEEEYRRQRLIPYPLYKKQVLLTPHQYSEGAKLPEPVPATVAGILKKPEGLSDEMISNDKKAYVSPSLGRKLLASTHPDADLDALMKIDRALVKIDDTSNVQAADDQIQKLKLSTQTNLHRMERMNDEFAIIRLIFAGAGLFILFVASISIVVAMTMSTYQRRRQIGIMKVLGANLKQIRNMFMIESSLLGFIGGVVGIIFSYWVIWGINIAVLQFSGGEEILFISPWILGLGIFFAILTGVLSGIYPAMKASRTDALTAIKRD